MTGDDFKAELARLGLTQAGFARRLTDLGHHAKGLDRTVRRWAQVGPPGEAVVILRLLEWNGQANARLQVMVDAVPRPGADAVAIVDRAMTEARRTALLLAGAREVG